jgi:hypothetical protein
MNNNMTTQDCVSIAMSNRAQEHLLSQLSLGCALALGTRTPIEDREDGEYNTGPMTSDEEDARGYSPSEFRNWTRR